MNLFKKQETDMKTNCYRIITDSFAGFEVQRKYKFCGITIWRECPKVGFTNTFSTLTSALKWIEDGCPRKRVKHGEVVWQSEGR